MAKYNLVVFHFHKMQQVSDFLSARNMMFAKAPDIEMHVISKAGAVPQDVWSRLAEAPSVLFSPLPIVLRAPLRGARVIAEPLTKLEEIERFAGAGFPVPRTKKILPGMAFDEAEWGPFIVVKPNRGMRGEGISLMRARDVRWVDPLSWPEKHPRHGVDMLAQQFVHPGPFSRCYRVFTVLGKAIYANTSTATERLPALDPKAAQPVEIDIAANGDARRIELSDDREVVDLAEKIHASFPYVPAMGLDFIRRDRTGEIYVLEMNSTGMTWHLSSDYGMLQQRKHGVDYYGQFNALRVLTDAFIDATRRLAI
jgi:hypothetical protein